jgi:hypothetical protein
MTTTSPIALHRAQTRKLARSLNKADVYHWLLVGGYFPESYVLPPCFAVVKRPKNPKLFYKIKKTKFSKSGPERTECVKVHFPKSELTDRSFESPRVS